MKNILYNFHYLIPLFFISIPLFPVNILKYIFFIPIILPLLWIIYGNCPLTNLHKKTLNEPTFLHSLFLKIFPKITAKTSDYIITFILILIVILSSLKIMIKHGVYKENIQNEETK